MSCFCAFLLVCAGSLICCLNLSGAMCAQPWQARHDYLNALCRVRAPLVVLVAAAVDGRRF
jgi:hypothetical protein